MAGGRDVLFPGKYQVRRNRPCLLGDIAPGIRWLAAKRVASAAGGERWRPASRTCSCGQLTEGVTEWDGSDAT